MNYQDAFDELGGDNRRQGDIEKGTLGALLHAKLARLLGVIHQQQKYDGAARIANLLSEGWAQREIHDGPAWASDITDDHTPFELSLAFGARGETARILTEPQDADDPSLLANWRLAQGIHERFAAEWGADLTLLRSVSDLFVPSVETTARFAIWHSAVLSEPLRPHLKVYLNPGMHGRTESVRVASEALDRLGLAECWRPIAERALARGEGDVPLYLSLDLLDPTEARVKIYIAHFGATAEEVAAALGACPGYPAERVAAWTRHLMGGSGPYVERPPLTCFAFCRGAVEPHSATLHLPVRCYGTDDFDIARRICGLLSFSQRVRYMRALTSASDRPLDAGRGLQTYVSLRNSPGRQGVTMYLAPEAYTPVAARADRSVHAIFPDVPMFGAAPPIGGEQKRVS